MLALFVLLSLGCWAQAAPQYAADRIVVKYKSAGGRPDIRAVKLKPWQTVSSAVGTYSQLPSVEYAEPDIIITHDPDMAVQPAVGSFTAATATGVIPNDPMWSAFQWNLQKIGAPSAWATSRGSTAFGICIVDSGVDATHPDLVGNLDLAHAINFNPAYPSTDYNDEFGHGTHAAGVAGSLTNNALGVAGINWQASIIPCRFLDGQGSGVASAAAQCINYCADIPSVRVISASWTFFGTPSQAIQDAITYAGSKGVLYVGSAGNRALNLDANPSVYPPAYKLPNQITVASTGQTDVLSSFSNYGAITVHLGAPGESIRSTLPPSTYGDRQGTSPAVPHVSGAAALVLAAAATRGRSLTAAQVKAQLLATVTPVPSLAATTVSGGRVNLAALLVPYRGGPPTCRASTANPLAGTGTAGVKVAPPKGLRRMMEW